MLKKVVATLFAVSAFTLGLAPAAFAVDGNNACDLPGDGTAGVPWEIDSQADLLEIGVGDCTAHYSLDHYYILKDNITLTGTWAPQGGLYSNTGFTASFDGDGFTISGLQVTGSNDNAGLFSDIRNAVIKDLTLKGTSVSGNDKVGALAGYVNESTIQNVRIQLSGDVQGARYVGGAIGEARNSTITEVFFYSTGEVRANQYLGGLLGAATDSALSALHVETQVIGSNSSNSVGGVIGMGIIWLAGGTYEQLFFNGRVLGGSTTGGLVGYAYAGSSYILTIRHSAVLGSVETHFNQPVYAFLGSYGQLIQRVVYVANYTKANFVMCATHSGCTPTPAIDVTGQQTDKSATYTSNLFSQVGTSTLHSGTASSADLTDPSSFNADWRFISQAGGAAVNTGTYSWILDTTGSRNSGLPFPAKLHNAGLFGSCDVGRFSANGFQPCTLAPAGTYVAVRTSTSAIDCPPGSFQPNTGATECLPTTAGHYTSSSAAIAETPCPAGSYQSSAGQTGCIPSPAGSHVPNPGSINHTPCAAGSFQPNTNQSSCVLAGVGFYVPAPGAVAEIACAAGTQSLTAGASACVAISSSPNAYQGPIVVGASGVAEIGGEATLRGSGLGDVTSASIDSLDCPIVTQSATSLTISLPEELTPGNKDLQLRSPAGVVVIQGAFKVTAPAKNDLSKSGFSITRKGDRVRYFVQNPVGIGKVQFFHNGREIAWLRTVDDGDPKLFKNQSMSYLVRTRDLARGKNDFKILVGGKSIRSLTLDGGN